MSEFYDGTKILSLMDINGKRPEIYLVTTNRSGGKTTYFGRLCVNKFLKQRSKFALLYRFNYELDSVSDKFFKDLSGLFFPVYSMTAVRRASGTFQELFLSHKVDGENSKPISCGYAISLNSADQLKKYSHFFSDVDRVIFDEFQSETNHYCNDEVSKFISIHTSIARGQGKQSRYVPVYMLGNTVSILNPYYTALGISERLNTETNFLRGDGYVIEQGFVDGASKAQKESAFNRAFSSTKQIAYATEGIYLNDNESFIEKPVGDSKYIATLRYNSADYAIRMYQELGILYCDDKPDITFKNKLAVTTDDHRINYVMLKNNDLFIQNMRYFFEKGCFRFKNLKCKEVIMKALTY